MAKKITGYIKLQIKAGQANPSPPVGPALGQRGVNIMEFCKAFNAATQKLEPGLPTPVVITVYSDRSFTFITKTPPATVLLSPDKKAGIVFAPFTTPQDGTTKVDKIVAFLKMKNPKWKKAKQVTIGPDKVPALFGTGKATSADGTPAKLYFSLIKTGGQQNLLAIGIADADAPEQTLKTGLNIVGSIKKKR